MKITIQPESEHWLVMMEGQPQRKFGSKAAAWAFVMGIRSADVITVIVYDAVGGKLAEATLNSNLVASASRQ